MKTIITPDGTRVTYAQFVRMLEQARLKIYLEERLESEKDDRVAYAAIKRLSKDVISVFKYLSL